FRSSNADISNLIDFDPNGDFYIANPAAPDGELGGWVRDIYEGMSSGGYIITVGPGGEFPTITEALIRAKALRKRSPEEQVEVLLMSGFELSEQVWLTGGESLAHIKLSSEDDIVIARSESLVRQAYANRRPFFYVD